MAPLNLRLSLLLTSCIAVPSTAFLLPSSTSATARTIELRSSPNSPDDWFRSESTSVGGRSVQPMENNYFVDPYGSSGMSKAGITQQQQRKPATVRFGGYRRDQAAKEQYYPQERKPNLNFSQRKDPEPLSAYQEWKKGDNRPRPGGVPTGVGKTAPRTKTFGRVQSETTKSPTRPSPSHSSQEKRPNLDFQNRREGTAKRPSLNFQEHREEEPLTAYQKWKLGDNRPRPGGMQTSVGVSAPTSPSEQRPQTQQGQPRTPVEGTAPNGFSSRPDKPGTWFQSEDSDFFQSSSSPNWPNQRFPKEQRDVPFEGYLTRKFSSKPDEPGAWFAKSNLDEEMPRQQPQSPAPRQERFERVPKQPQSQPQSVRFEGSKKGERCPNIPSAAKSTQSVSRSSEPPQVKRPVIPQMGNQRQPENYPRNQPPKMNEPTTQERRPKIPTMNSSSSTEQVSAKAPFQAESQVFQRYSAPPMPQQQQLREPPRVVRAEVRERMDPTEFPQQDFPRAPPPTGGIMPYEPFPESRPGVGTVMPLQSQGGPLGPVSYSWDSPVLTGAGNGGRRYYDQFSVPDEIIQGAGSRKTWETSHHDSTIVEVGSQGRPVMATAQVWQGPGNTPARMSMYSEDGAFRPWRASFQNTDRSGGNSVLDVRNEGPMAFPLDVGVVGKHDGSKGVGKMEKDFVDQVEYNYVPSEYKVTQTVQGQSLKYFNIKRGVAAVHVELFSEGRPIFVQVELWQGPSATKQSAEIYSDNGNDRHWSAIIDTHGQECVIAVRNVGPALVYPIKASVDPILM